MMNLGRSNEPSVALSPPSPESSPSSSCPTPLPPDPSDFTDRTQFPFTPPPSLPTSIPSSPEYSTKLLKGKHKAEPGPSTSYLDPLRSTSRTKTRSSARKVSPGTRPSPKDKGSTEYLEVSALPEGYGDDSEPPILPRTKIPFPTSLSDDDSSGPASRSRHKWRSEDTGGRRRRVVSEQTTTTSRVEKQNVRYSFLWEEEILGGASASNEPTTPSQTTKPAVARRKNTSKTRGLLPSSDFFGRPRSSSHGHDAILARPSASRSPSNRLKPTSTISSPRPSSHSRSPFAASSLSNATLPHVASPRRARPASKPRPPRLFTRSLVVQSSSPTSPELPSSPFGPDSAALATALTENALPLFRPFVNMFTFLLVTSFCCMTVSAVLVASFSLTLYDDCGRRLLSGLNRNLRAGARTIEGSLDGVRSGMGRMIGGAKGALDLAVKATEAISSNGEPSARARAGGAFASRGMDQDAETTMPTVPIDAGRDDEDADDEGNDEGRARSRRLGTRPSSSSTRTRSSSSSTSRAGGGSVGGVHSTLRRTLKPFTTFASPSPSSPPASAEQEPPRSPFRPASSPTTPSEPRSGWATDEDALPYDVPHPTPFASRPASPHRSPRARQSSASSTASTGIPSGRPGLSPAPPPSPRLYSGLNGRPRQGDEPQGRSTPPPNPRPAPILPQRPHLTVLIPSLLFAVFLTLAKLAYTFWINSKDKGGRQTASEAKNPWRDVDEDENEFEPADGSGWRRGARGGARGERHEGRTSRRRTTYSS
ncbi:hypothetical protein JCM10212_005227 [Sporobolomyces blumeae]